RHVPTGLALLADGIAQVWAAVLDDVKTRLIVIVSLQPDAPRIDDQATARNRSHTRQMRVAAENERALDSRGTRLEVGERRRADALLCDVLEKISVIAVWPAVTDEHRLADFELAGQAGQPPLVPLARVLERELVGVAAAAAGASEELALVIAGDGRQ